MAKNTKMDASAGLSVNPPKSKTMEYWKTLVSATGKYDDRGHPTKTGKQSEKIGSGKCADATTGTGKYKQGMHANKGPKAVVSKRTAGKVNKVKGK